MTAVNKSLISLLLIVGGRGKTISRPGDFMSNELKLFAHHNHHPRSEAMRLVGLDSFTALWRFLQIQRQSLRKTKQKCTIHGSPQTIFSMYYFQSYLVGLLKDLSAFRMTKNSPLDSKILEHCVALRVVLISSSSKK